MTIRETRGFFARCMLGSSDNAAPEAIGSIALRRHQQAAVTRVNAAIAEFGGALVSDHVGTGKTYVALALAAKCADATVVAPAVLKEMWISAASSADVRIIFMSTESLSRSSSRAAPNAFSAGSLVIVDEAQHFRNPATRRFASLAQLCSGRRVVLLSATPIHNCRRDLEVLLSLFIGSRAASLSPSELGRVVIRRTRDNIADSARMPAVVKPQWCELTHDDEIPRLLLSLPPPLSPRDGGDGGALVVHSLIRQWVSSDKALHRALVRRLQKATALVAALESGTYPSRSDLGAWISGEDCVQLGFAELMAPANPGSQTLLPIVRRHLAAVRSLAQRMKVSNARDLERAGVIRELRRKHGGVRVVAFSQYADTVEGFFDLLASDGSVAVLTGTGARVFGGRISRVEAIERFAPDASGRKSPRAADAITLLLTTDILSEGVNLQDAGVVIHLDLPWTPARMEQRVGRVARMGSRHESVFSYVMRPPASSDALIRAEGILRTKMASAGVVTDELQSILPGGFPALHDENLPRVVEAIRSMLEDWVKGAVEEMPGEVIASAAIAPISGFIALCRTGQYYRILAGDSQGVTDDPFRVLAMMRCAGGREIDFQPEELEKSVAVAKRYLRAASAVGASHSQSHPRQLVQRRALRRIADIVSSARPHERSYIVPASSRARATVLGRLSAGQEGRLAALSAAYLPDVEWLCAVAALSSDSHVEANKDEVVAMILFRSTLLRKHDCRTKMNHSFELQGRGSDGDAGNF